MTEQVATTTTVTDLIVTPKLSKKDVSINKTWLNQRDNYLREVDKILKTGINEKNQLRAEELKTILGKHAKALEENRLEVTRPINKVTTLIKKTADAEIKLANEGKTKIVGAVYDFIKEKERIQQEALAELNRLEALEEAKRIKAEGTVDDDDDGFGSCYEPEVQTPVIHKPLPEVPKSTLKMRKTWFAKVTDPTLVPREFLCVDQKKLDTYIKTMKETAPNVAGVTFGFTDQLV